LSNRDYFELNS